jgi:hypothetical protein
MLASASSSFEGTLPAVAQRPLCHFQIDSGMLAAHSGPVEKVANLTPEQVAYFSPEWVANFPPESMAKLLRNTQPANQSFWLYYNQSILPGKESCKKNKDQPGIIVDLPCPNFLFCIKCQLLPQEEILCPQFHA